MKKKLFLLAISVLMISGCGKIPTLSNGDEVLVTLKDGHSISVNEYYEKLKSEESSVNIMVEMVDTKILEDKYKDKIEEAKTETDNQMATLEQQYGDQLDQVIQQYTGLSGAEAYKSYVYIETLRGYAIKDYAKAQITEKEIKKYYEDKIVGDIKVSHILISSKAAADATDEEKAKAEKEAKEKAEAIIAELNKTAKNEVTKKFAELASAKSEDAVTKKNGGSFGFINKDTLSEEYAELVDAAYKLKDGEYSTKVVKTELGYHVILRTETKAKASLDSVKDNIVDTLATDYMAKNSVVKVKALQELRKEYGFKIEDSSLQSKYASNIQEELNYYQQADQEGQKNE